MAPEVWAPAAQRNVGSTYQRLSTPLGREKGPMINFIEKTERSSPYNPEGFSGLYGNVSKVLEDREGSSPPVVL